MPLMSTLRRALRLRPWILALLLQGRQLPVLTLLHAASQVPVHPALWHHRMRTCLRCPLHSIRSILSIRVHLCLSSHPAHPDLGCGCYTPLKATAPSPYANGCWGHTKTNGALGWGPVKETVI